MSPQPTVLVYAPHSFSGRGPAETCAAIVDHFDPALIRTQLFLGRSRRPLAPHVEVRRSVGAITNRFPWRLASGRALDQLNRSFAEAIDKADPSHTVAYFWPDPPLELVRRARSRGIITVREMINTARATSGPILDAAFARQGLPPTHGVTQASIAAETAELRSHSYLFASNREVERSLLDLSIEDHRILSTSFGWSPQRFRTESAPTGTRDGLRLLFLGSLSIRKGVPELLEAWRRAGVDGELVLAGPTASEVEGLVDRGSRPGRVRVVGYVNDVANLFRSSDIFVFPTLEEGGPQVTYEAAGCGLPVLTTPMGAARLVEDGVTGVVVDGGSVDQLTQAIRNLAERSDLRASYGDAARRRAQDYTYERVGADRCRHLSGMLAGKG